MNFSSAQAAASVVETPVSISHTTTPRLTATPARKSRNSAASVQTTAAMPPSQVQRMATARIAATAATWGGTPVALSSQPSSRCSSTPSTTAER